MKIPKVECLGCGATLEWIAQDEFSDRLALVPEVKLGTPMWCSVCGARHLVVEDGLRLEERE